MKTKFSHLHIHTCFSVLDGMPKIRELIETVKKLGQTACCITDHGSMSGLWEAQKLGDELGVKVLLGCEFYYERENDGSNGHLIVIAKNDVGLRNMMQLQEFAYVHNFYKKPRINWDNLVVYHEGLIVTSACLASTFSQYIMNGDIENAKQWVNKFKEVFGKDFYLEVQANSIDVQALVNKETMRIAKQLGVKVIASNDVHYILKTDSFPHEILLALQTNKKLSDPKRFKFSIQDFWLKSEQEMFDTLNGLTDDEKHAVLDCTSEIVDKCTARFTKGNYLPEYYDIPEGQTARALLVNKTKAGIKREHMQKEKNFLADVQNEIDVIDRNGYSGYFLIVGDYVTTARKQGNIVGDGRGSGAGSKTAWLTEITKIPPHKYDLLFERFLADGREPDFDVDFADQDAVFADLQSKYGEANVARIIAFGTLTPKAICRKIFSVFEHDVSITNQISKLIPDLCPTLEEACKASPELLNYKQKYPTEFQVIERLEGIVSHESQHAGGVIICKGLSSVLPIKTKGEDRTKRIVAFDMNMVHELGHFKFDILGLKTLPIIKGCLDSITNTTGEIVDLYTIDTEDSAVYDMLCRGDVSGIFQLNNQAQKIMEQQPRCFKDLIAINALIRPGVGDWEEYIARRKGKEWSVHPDRLSYMNETVGTMTYQEQFLLDAKTFGGWDIAYADKHIRKNKSIRTDEELRSKFLTDATQRGYSSEEMLLVWAEIENAVDGGYSFNKSHSASYAIISYQTAWLKCHYPEHFYASLMSYEKTDGDGQDAISGYIAECKQRGITILPPDINKSGEDFTVTNGGINYRITTIKHVGESAIKSITNLRPVESFLDFMERKEKRHIKTNVLTNLIKAGSFDFDNPNRAELLWLVDMENRTKTQIKQNYEYPKYDWNDLVKASWEKEVLGMYLSVHPMEKYGFKPLTSIHDGQYGIQGGEIYDLRVFKDKNQNEMAFVFLNTLFGNIKILVFASSWRNTEIKDLIQINNIVLVKGKRNGDALILDGVELLQ